MQKLITLFVTHLCGQGGRHLLFGLLLLFSASQQEIKAQVIGNWNFNNITSGVAGPLNLVSTADFSSSVGSTAFNGSMEYYGHNGWPTGALDPDMYLQFTLVPNIGYALNINSMILRLRHSNTGSGGGSGPKQFSVRSSVDGFTADIASGSVTAAYANHTITAAPAVTAFIGAVTFRVYGYMSVLYSGGNNRFVFDNIEVSSIGVILPVKLISFTAQPQPGKVSIYYAHENADPAGRTIIERSLNGIDWVSITSNIHNSDKVNAHFTDINPGNDYRTIYYRLKIDQRGEDFFYSRIQTIPVESQAGSIRASLKAGSLVLSGDIPANINICLVNISGIVVYKSQLQSQVSGRLYYLAIPYHLAAGPYHAVVYNDKIKKAIPVFQQ